jgi:phosphonoacetaldehyde hydrolase
LATVEFIDHRIATSYWNGISMHVKAVLFDWAGTTVDFGSRAPVQVFMEVFDRIGIQVTEAEARGPMGKAKREHIASVISLPRIAALWEERFGMAPTGADVDALYADFLPLQLAVLSKGSDVIPGIPQLIEALRNQGLKIGSSTGYTRALMEAVVPVAKAQGYEPDCVVCSDEVSSGRPQPWLNFKACELLDVYPPQSVIVVDDTPIGIQAARNAGMWAVGVSMTGNGLGLSQADASALPEADLTSRLERITSEYLAAGAHFVVRSATELLSLLPTVNQQLERGIQP